MTMYCRSNIVISVGGSSSSGATRLETLPQRLDAIPSRLVITDLACGLGHALFLTDAGCVLSWGNGGSGRLGLGNTADQAEACVITGTNNTPLFCGHFTYICDFYQLWKVFE